VTERKEEAEGDTALTDNPRRDGGIFLPPQLYSDEANYQGTEQHEESDNATIAPWVGRAAPLQGQEKADNAGNEEKCSDWVKLLDLLAYGLTGLERGAFFENEGQDHDRRAADWQVDVD